MVRRGVAAGSMLASLLQWQQLDLPKPHRLALGLQGDVAVAQPHIATGGGDVARRGDGAGGIEHRALVAQHFDAVDAMDDLVVAAHFHFSEHPLFRRKGRRARFSDVFREKLPRHLHMRARRAQIARGARAFALIGEELHLQARWEALVEAHALRRLRVQHHAAVEVHILRRIGHHRAGEAILHAQDVMRVGQVGEEVSVLLVKLLVAIVAHLQDTVFDAKRVREILPQRPLRDLDRPPGQILAIEERNPLRLLGGGIENDEGKEDGAGRSDHARHFVVMPVKSNRKMLWCILNSRERIPGAMRVTGRRLPARHEMPPLCAPLCFLWFPPSHRKAQHHRHPR